MRRALPILLLPLSLNVAHAGERVLQGRVTYIASGTVYTSLGRLSGITDSSRTYIIAKTDTIAVLRVFAVSSSSSVCSVLTAKRPPRIGDEVSAVVMVPDSLQAVIPTSDTVRGVQGATTRVGTDLESIRFKTEEQSAVQWRGRISAQYYGTRYASVDLNTSQPGVVMNLQANSTALPLRLELYSNVKTLSYSGSRAKSSANLSRLYRLTLTYDDGTAMIAAGRMIPSAIPSIGYLDGFLASVRFGQVEFGSLLGYQPTLTLRGVATEYRKIGGFVRVVVEEPLNLTVSTAYARTYFHNGLDREMFSAQVNAFTSYNFYVYANSEVDLRKKSGNDLVLSPSLTSAFVNLNYRFNRMLTVGLGADASRPVLPFSVVRGIPDSLLDFRLKSGVNLNVSLSLPGAISLSDSYSPRYVDSGFGKEYTNVASLGLADVLSTGITVRSNLTSTTNAFTSSMGYGGYVQRDIIGWFDLSVRYQQHRYKVRASGRRDNSTTVGADLLIALTRQLGLMTSYDNLESFGSRSHSIFAELTLRF